jgi:hypothetical protein
MRDFGLTLTNPPARLRRIPTELRFGLAFCACGSLARRDAKPDVARNAARAVLGGGPDASLNVLTSRVRLVDLTCPCARAGADCISQGDA